MTTKKTSVSDSLGAKVLADAEYFLTSAIRAEREGRTSEAFVNAESAAVRISSYLDCASLSVGVKPKPCTLRKSYAQSE